MALANSSYKKYMYTVRKDMEHLAHLVLQLSKFIICQRWNAVIFVLCLGWFLCFSHNLTLSTGPEFDELRDKNIHQRCIHPVQTQPSSTEERLAVRIVRVNSLNTNGSAIKVV